jgi:hypothetical protein
MPKASDELDIKSRDIPPVSPYFPWGPVHYVREYKQWSDREKSAYIMHDIQMSGVSGIDDDQWVADFLVQLLWDKIRVKEQS